MRLGIGICVLFLCLVFVSQEVRAEELRIILENVKAGKGMIYVKVVESEEDWDALMDGKETKIPLRGQRVEVGEATSQEVVIGGLDRKGLEEGLYGVTAYQDVDGNGELKRGLFGIPSEPVGFSNDAPIFFGPPKFSKAKLKLGAGENTITIHF